MLVFPFIFGYPRWLYLLLFLAFLVAGILFNRFLRHSLRNGPRWGKSSAPTMHLSRRLSVITQIDGSLVNRYEGRTAA